MIEILIILLLLLINGLFAMSEIALVSSRKSKLEKMAAEGSKGAEKALQLLLEPEKFLSTVQIGITLVGIIAGAYGGETLTAQLKPSIEKVGWLSVYSEEISFTIIVILITYFSLIIGELVPKTIALNNPEKITVGLSSFMRGVSFVTYPIVLFLSLSTKLLLKVLTIKVNKEPPITEEELRYLIDSGSKHGIIEKEEKEIIHSVMALGDFKAGNIMTDRSQISWIDINYEKNQILDIIRDNGYSKYPLCEHSLDKVFGIITAKDILLNQANLSPEVLKELSTKPLFISGNTSALKILESFKTNKIHTGIVVDEYGGVDGIITLHDLIENVLGDLPDIEDVTEPSAIKRSDGSILVDGAYEVNELKKLLQLKAIPGEFYYKTIGGFIISYLKRIPQSGDKFQLGEYWFEIIDKDGTRIDKVLITKN